jgi:hypothetical protein
LLKADLHVHTRYSKDSTSPPEEIVRHCLDTGINCLAITDHDTMAGAIEVKRIAPFKVIVGEEILTNRGEIIGYFLNEEVPPHLSPAETIARIKEQGGLVCIPHPYDRFRPHSKLRRDALKRILPQVDMIEIANSRTFLSRDSRRALELARVNGLPGTAGSDAHVVGEIGKTYLEMPDFKTPQEFLAALRQAGVVSNKTSILIHFYNIRNRLIKRLGRG